MAYRESLNVINHIQGQINMYLAKSSLLMALARQDIMIYITRNACEGQRPYPAGMTSAYGKRRSLLGVFVYSLILRSTINLTG